MTDFVDLLLFGSARGCHRTLPFFQSFATKHDADIFAHTLYTSHEEASYLKIMLGGTKKIEEQSIVDRKEGLHDKSVLIKRNLVQSITDIRKTRTFPRPTNYSSSTILNWLRSKYSLGEVYALFARGSAKRFAFVSRLDLIVKDLSLPTSALNSTLYVPNFHHNTGLNDRMAFGTRNVVAHYAGIYYSLTDIRFGFRVRSTEGALCSHVIKHPHMRVGLFHTCFVRYRDSGMAILDKHMSRHEPYECISKGLNFGPTPSTGKCAYDVKDINLVRGLTISGDSTYYLRQAEKTCKNVAFTTIIYTKGDFRKHFQVPKMLKPPRGWCYIALVSTHVATKVPVDKWEYWRYIILDITTQKSSRIVSKWFKLNFITLSSARYFVFIDSKLNLNKSPDQIMATMPPKSSIMFFKHPCAYKRKLAVKICEYDHRVHDHWYKREAEICTNKKKTNSNLNKTLADLREIKTTDYADTAIIAIRRTRVSLSFLREWSNVLMDNNLDRDQLGLIFVEHKPAVYYRDVLWPQCQTLCSWWATHDPIASVFKKQPIQ